MALYSAVRGACWPAPRGMAGSQARLPILDHSPFQSGYVASSKAAAPEIVSNSAKPPIELRWSMRAPFDRGCGRYSSHALMAKGVQFDETPAHFARKMPN